MKDKSDGPLDELIRETKAAIAKCFADTKRVKARLKSIRRDADNEA